MNRYEIPFIVNADLNEDEINSILDRYQKIITDAKGIVVKIEKWGKRKLAYEIKKQRNGYYILLDFVGESSLVNELERNFKIDDRILRYLTIKKEDKVDPAKIEKEKEAMMKAPGPREESTSEAPLLISTEKMKGDTASESTGEAELLTTKNDYAKGDENES